MSQLTVLPQDTPDTVDVELLMAGVVMQPSQRTRIQQAMAGDLSDEAAELEAFRRDWAATDLPALAPPVVPPAANGGVWWRSVVLVAAVLLGVLSIAVVERPEGDGIRSMGLLPVDSWVLRDGESRMDGGAYRVDDQVFVRMTMPHSGFVSVALVQESGDVTLFSRSSRQHPLTRGTVFSLDGALMLDDDPGREWLVVALTDTWLEDEEMRKRLGATLPDPAVAAPVRGWWAREVTRGR